MRIFEEQQRKEFCAALKTYLKGFHAGRLEGLSETDIDHRIQASLKRAESYGLTWGQSLTVFVSLAFIIGPAFDQYPAAQAILGDPGIRANEKPQALLRRISSEQWHDAAHRPLSS